MIHHVSGWIYAVAVVNLIAFLICYYAGRKRLDVQYYLCPKCADRRKINSISAVTTALVAAIITAVSLTLGETMMVFYGVLTFGAASVAHAFFQRAPMKALTFDGSHFSVKGISHEATNDLQKALPPAQ